MHPVRGAGLNEDKRVPQVIHLLCKRTRLLVFHHFDKIWEDITSKEEIFSLACGVRPQSLVCSFCEAEGRDRGHIVEQSWTLNGT